MWTANDFEKIGHYESSWSPVKIELEYCSSFRCLQCKREIDRPKRSEQPQILTEVQMQEEEITKEANPFTSSKENPEILFNQSIGIHPRKYNTNITLIEKKPALKV